MTQEQDQPQYPTFRWDEEQATYHTKKNADLTQSQLLEIVEKNALSKIELVEKYQALIATQWEKDEGPFYEYNPYNSGDSYITSMLDYPFGSLFDQAWFEESFRDVEKLANDILRGEVNALSYCAAYDAMLRASQKQSEIRKQTVENLNRQKKGEASTSESENETSHQLEPANIWEVLSNSADYQIEVGKQTLARDQVRATYLKWLSISKDEVRGASSIAKEVKTLDYESVDEFAYVTTQEISNVIRAAADGRYRNYWRNYEQRGVRAWEGPKSSHRIEISLTIDSEIYTFTFEELENLTDNQTNDLGLVINYIIGVLCPPIVSGDQQNIIGGRIDLNDVLAKIGWLKEKPDAAKLEKLRAQLWDLIRFGAYAKVIGRRSTPYYDSVIGEQIETQVESALWSLNDIEYPQQDDSSSQSKIAPLSVFVVISQQWQRLLEDPRLTQYYPHAELLGQIPSNKISGDWARVMGGVLFRLWRMKPGETLDGSFSPTRKELLTSLTPKTKTLEEMLNSDDPKRAVKNYIAALNILVTQGLIAAQGDAAKEITPTEMLKNYGRKGWQLSWMKGHSNLYPGSKLIASVTERAEARPERKPKAITAKKRKSSDKG